MPNTIDVKDRNDLDLTLYTQEYSVGIPTDTAATADTGTWSLIALTKRLLAKLPTLVSGRWPVDGSAVTQPVSGTFWQATQPVSVATLPALAAGTNNIGDVDVLSLPTTTSVATTTVAGSASVVTLLASNTSRKGATIYNDSTALLYVKLGSAASTTSFNAQLAGISGSSPGGYYEIPYSYTGIVTGVWASATGNARIGEAT